MTTKKVSCNVCGIDYNTNQRSEHYKSKLHLLFAKKVTPKRGRPKVCTEDRSNPTDKIICEICGMEFSRSNRTRHQDSKMHQLAVRLTSKAEEIEDPDKYNYNKRKVLP